MKVDSLISGRNVGFNVGFVTCGLTLIQVSDQTTNNVLLSQLPLNASITLKDCSCGRVQKLLTNQIPMRKCGSLSSLVGVSGVIWAVFL